MRTIRSDSAQALSWSGDDRIADNVRNALRIVQGESAFTRPLGLNPTWSGSPSLATRRLMASEVRENIAEYEPDAKIIDVRVVLDEHGAAVIEVDIDE